MDLFWVVIIWLFALCKFTWQYLRMNDHEKSTFKEEIKRPIVLVDVLRILGFLFLFTGLIYKDMFISIGVVMFSITWFANGYLIYRTNRKVSFLSITASISIMLLYFGRYLWDIMV